MNAYVILIIPYQMLMHLVMLCDNNDTYLPVMFFLFQYENINRDCSMLCNSAKCISIYVVLCAIVLVVFIWCQLSGL